jgi:hypothetical protein
MSPVTAQTIKLPVCIYCPSKARVGCHDCGAPMCQKHATVESGVFYKCRQHTKKLVAGESERGVLQGS